MQEKNLIPTRKNKEASTEKTAFDLGLEEGAEFQDRKLGRRIQPLQTEPISKAERFFADQVNPCLWVLFIEMKKSKVGWMGPYICSPCSDHRSGK